MTRNTAKYKVSGLLLPSYKKVAWLCLNVISKVEVDSLIRARFFECVLSNDGENASLWAFKQWLSQKKFESLKASQVLFRGR